MAKKISTCIIALSGVLAPIAAYAAAECGGCTDEFTCVSSFANYLNYDWGVLRGPAYVTQNGLRVGSFHCTGASDDLVLVRVKAWTNPASPQFEGGNYPDCEYSV